MPEMKYVDRDAQGKICGIYAREQRKGQESLPEDHTEIVARVAAIAAKEAEVKAAPSVADEIADLKRRIEALESAAKA